MSGGVRNLRAMFENKDQSTSPPDTRGRSPAAGSTGAHSNGASPRPLSKVRTSFVAVEKSGQMGLKLRRETSGEPSMAKRRESFSIDEEEQPEATAERKDSLAAEIKARKNSAVIEETIPESAVETPPIEVDKQLGDKRKEILNFGNPEDKKPVAIASSGAKTWSGASNGQTNGTTKPATVAKNPEKATVSRTTARPAPISTAKTSTAPKASPKITKSPAMPKTPTTPSRSHTKETHTKNPEKKPSHTSKPTAKPPTTAAHGSSPKTRIQPSPPQSGFVKPRPKSPTRPVKLPASLTAHTASSGSKTATAPQPTSRQSLSRGETSGTVQPTHSLQSQSRSPSRVNKSSSTIARQPSTLNKSSRPSLGPPPGTLKKQSSRQSLPHQSTAPDDSFLARMMRPTTSSASKTADAEKALPQRIQSVKRLAAKEEPVKGHAVSTTSTLSAKTAKPAAVSKLSPASKPTPKETKPATSVATKHEAAKATEPKVGKPTESGSATKANVPEVKGTAVESKVARNGVSEASFQKPKAEEAKVAEEEVAEDKSTKPLIGENSVEKTSTVVEPTQEKEEKLEPKLETIEETSEAKKEKKAEPVYDEYKTISAVAEDVSSTEVEPIVPVDQAEVTEGTPITSKAEPSKLKEVEVAIAPKPSPVKGEVDVKPTAEIATPEEAKVEITPEPTKVETPPAPKEVKPATAEDPEDVKAREEIARLNAEVLKSAAESTDSV